MSRDHNSLLNRGVTQTHILLRCLASARKNSRRFSGGTCCGSKKLMEGIVDILCQRHREKFRCVLLHLTNRPRAGTILELVRHPHPLAGHETDESLMWRAFQEALEILQSHLLQASVVDELHHSLRLGGERVLHFLLSTRRPRPCRRNISCSWQEQGLGHGVIGRNGDIVCPVQVLLAKQRCLWRRHKHFAISLRHLHRRTLPACGGRLPCRHTRCWFSQHVTGWTWTPCFQNSRPL
mmetsp:Transcript_19010/g.50880  ORF Transcript_19010/g.50880 Transcript_19010/m.50880 type:complete len:237 (-) Transcript_19010:1401-2111(-)